MPNFNALKKFFPALSREEGTVYNKAAIEALKRQKAEEAELAAQLAAGADQPLTSKPFEEGLSNIDKTKLPEAPNTETGFQLIGEPQERGFTLGESGPISRPPVPLEPEVISSLPVKAGPRDIELPKIIDVTPEAAPNLSGINLPSSTVDKYNYLKNIGKIGAAGTAATLAMNMGGGKPPVQNMKASASTEQPNQAAQPQEVQEPETEVAKALKTQMALLARPSAEERITVPPTSTVDFGAGNLANQETLNKIQALQNDTETVNAFARIGAQMATGGQTENKYDKIIADQQKAAGGLVKQYQDKIEFQKQDPMSSVSQGYRNLAKAMGFDIKGMASAADIEKQFPQLSNIYNQRQAQAARRDIARENREARLAMLQLQLAQHKDATLDKLNLKDEDRLIKLNERLNSPQMGSARNALGRNQLIINGAGKIEALIKSQKNPDNLTGRQVYEIAKSLDGMLSMGSPTISGTDKLIPKTLMAELAQGGEYVMNKPVGAKMGAFVKQMQELIERERGIAVQQNQKFKEQIVAGLPQDFTKRRQKDIENMLSVHTQGVADVMGPAAGMQDMVKVKTKEGKIGRIPRANLEEAKKLGIVEVKE